MEDENVFNPPLPPRSINPCPLCSSEIKLYFINFNEKMRMCENLECDFPFGYEELQFMKEDMGSQCGEELVSLNTMSFGSRTPSVSVISAGAWSEIEKINRAILEDAPMEPDSIFTGDSDINKHKNKQEAASKKQICKDVMKLKELNSEIRKHCKNETSIKDEKLIKSLMSLQGMSHVSTLLKKDELEIVKDTNRNEIKVDIDAGTEFSNPTITIEIKAKTSSSGSEVQDLANS